MVIFKLGLNILIEIMRPKSYVVKYNQQRGQDGYIFTCEENCWIKWDFSNIAAERREFLLTAIISFCNYFVLHNILGLISTPNIDFVS